MTLEDISIEYCPEYYRPYLDGLPKSEQLLDLMQNQLGNFPEFLASIPFEKWNYSYAPGKWTLMESIVHVLDTERVFQYRSLCFGRKDESQLPGFDQDKWVIESNTSGYSPSEIIEEYQIIRSSTIALFRKFSELDLKFVGTASNKKISLGILGFLICGHQRHHRDIIRNNYL
jgi:hypothetical protein